MITRAFLLLCDGKGDADNQGQLYLDLAEKIYYIKPDAFSDNGAYCYIISYLPRSSQVTLCPQGLAVPWLSALGQLQAL